MLTLERLVELWDHNRRVMARHRRGVPARKKKTSAATGRLEDLAATDAVDLDAVTT